jgi:hypothetical protein
MSELRRYAHLMKGQTMRIGKRERKALRLTVGERDAAKARAERSPEQVGHYASQWHKMENHAKPMIDWSWKRGKGHASHSKVRHIKP